VWVDKMGEMSGMWEGIMLSLLFVILLTAVLGYYNAEYGQDNNVGLETDAWGTQFAQTTNTAYGETGGEVTQTSDGLTLASSWNMGKAIFGTLWDFLAGGWIRTIIVDILKIEDTAGEAISFVLRTLFLGMLIFGLIKLFFKVSS